jgi:hypothetical protein
MTTLLFNLFIKIPDFIKLIKAMKYLFVKKDRLVLKKCDRKTFGPFEFHYRLNGSFELDIDWEETVICNLEKFYEVTDQVIKSQNNKYGEKIYDLKIYKKDVRRIDSDIIIEFVIKE